VTAGAYPYDEVKRIPDDLRARYFLPPGETGGQWTIRDELRQRVSFVKHDLLSLQPPRRGFCLILCKNVLLHFRDEQRVAVLRMFHDALDEGGFLVTEQTQGLPAELAPLFASVTPHARIYRKLACAATRSL
jgi:chemotaxis protein methyltransferase CheR